MTTTRHLRSRAIARTGAIGRAGAAAVLVLGLAAATGCSSSGTETTAGAPPTTTAPGTSSTDAPGTTQAPVTTKAPPSPEAAAGNLTAADLGAGWADYPSEAGVYGTQSNSCTNATGLLEDMPDESVGDGTIIQYGDRLVFAQSTAYVFPSPAEAQAYAAYLLSEPFVECRRAQLQSFLPESDPPVTIVATGSHTGDGSTPYVGSFSYEDQEVVDGTTQTIGSSRHAIYVKGRIVIDLFTQVGAKDGDPPDLNVTTNDMIDVGMAATLSRVAP